jgi:hypothetical protein
MGYKSKFNANEKNKNFKPIILQVTKSKPHSQKILMCDAFFSKIIKNTDTKNGNRDNLDCRQKGL